jgi:hypothetical protein
MFFLWTDEDLDLWMKLHYATTGSAKGTGWTGDSGWTGNFDPWRVENFWFIAYAAVALLTPFLRPYSTHRLCEALLALVSLCAVAHSTVFLHEAVVSDRVMIARGGWIGLVSVATCLVAGWVETRRPSRYADRDSARHTEAGRVSRG